MLTKATFMFHIITLEVYDPTLWLSKPFLACLPSLTNKPSAGVWEASTTSANSLHNLAVSPSRYGIWPKRTCHSSGQYNTNKHLMTQKTYHLCFMPGIPLFQITGSPSNGDICDYILRARLLQPSKQHSNSTRDESSLQPFPQSSKSLTPKKQNMCKLKKTALPWLKHSTDFTNGFWGNQTWLSVLITNFSQSSKWFSPQCPKSCRKIMLSLQHYNFAVVYRKGSSLSRHPVWSPISTRGCQPLSTRNLPRFPSPFWLHRPHVTIQKVLYWYYMRATMQGHSIMPKHETSRASYIHGWPPGQEHLPLQFKAFWHFWVTLTVEDGILLNSACAIVLFACLV